MVPGQDRHIEYRSLGRTGVKVSPLCLGTMNFGSRTPEDEAVRMIDRAIEAGLNLIDTANLYGDANEGVGRTEKIIGEALSRNGKRNRIVLATKVFFPMDPSDPNSSGLSRRHILAECEASLRRLRTDYIDLYQLHRPVPGIAIDETLRALDDLIHAGNTLSPPSGIDRCAQGDRRSMSVDAHTPRVHRIDDQSVEGSDLRTFKDIEGFFSREDATGLPQ